ncbi:MAG: hypothetical protein IAE92_16525 [Burkholderiaceae bacterium]|nr:hypothetical protein [Burkholderiaceae bacterium]
MIMKKRFRAALAVFSGPGVAAEVPFVAGDLRTRSTSHVKKGHLVGIANVIQLEMAYGAGIFAISGGSGAADSAALPAW